MICCSRYMRGELQRIFQLPLNKLRVIPNGVYPEPFRRQAGDVRAIRRKYAADDEQVVFYVGRLVFEKGLDLLLAAAPRILAHNEKVKFIIAGKGPYAEHLHHRAREMGLYHKFYFTGYVDDLTRNALFSTADVAVSPSMNRSGSWLWKRWQQEHRWLSPIPVDWRSGPARKERFEGFP